MHTENGLLGYLHKSIFFTGVSIGITTWNAGGDAGSSNYNYDGNISYSPIDATIDVRVFPIRNRFTPVFIVDAGYSINPGLINDNYYYRYSDGFLLNVGAGGRVNITQKRSLTMAVCYKAQRLHVSRANNNNYYNNNSPIIYPNDGKPFYLEGLCLTLGFAF